MSSAPTPITSRDNPLLKRLRLLAQDSTAYRKQGQVWLEGDHLCRALSPVEADHRALNLRQSSASPFWSPRLDAVRCVFRCVASIITVSVSCACPASSVMMVANTPIRLQRFQRL